jgi:hypothetical protein
MPHRSLAVKWRQAVFYAAPCREQKNIAAKPLALVDPQFLRLR